MEKGLGSKLLYTRIESVLMIIYFCPNLSFSNPSNLFPGSGMDSWIFLRHDLTGRRVTFLSVDDFIQIDQVEERDYNATDVEMTKIKMMNIDLEHHIKAVKKLQNAVEEAMCSLESDLQSYKNQDIAVGVASTAASAAGGFAGGYAVGLLLNTVVGAGNLDKRPG